jgi:hypothetical protein
LSAIARFSLSVRLYFALAITSSSCW